MGVDERSHCGRKQFKVEIMIRIGQIKLGAFLKEEEVIPSLKVKAAKKLRIDEKAISSLSISKRSLDARKKNEIVYVYTVDVCVNNEKNIRIKDKDISFVENRKYRFPYIKEKDSVSRPIIVGFGPAGIFCAYMLAKAGFRPVVFERGSRVEERTEAVKQFWEKGVLNPDSNVQFGEGGAGTFSDGKLNTMIKDKYGRHKAVLEIFVENGAKESILYDNKPHIGTDVLSRVVKNLREKIIQMGGEVHFNTTVEEIVFDDNHISAVIAGGNEYKTDALIMAPGHSARDTFSMLHGREIAMSPKAFAVGLRVMHPRKLIDESRYGAENCEKGLEAADYKLTYTTDEKRGVYSFCMCPGGYVVNASSEEGYSAVNGMSYSGRDSESSNSAIVVQVFPEDFGDDGVLAGVSFQRKLERKAYEIAEGAVPVRRYGDFRHAVKPQLSPEGILEVKPLIKGLYREAPVEEIMPDKLNEAFVEGMEHFGNIIEGFNDGNVILAGVESRTSSPVRIERDENGNSINCMGLFPCGEGAGYAGGITSAAIDGIYIAECVAKYLNEKN